MRSVVVLGGGNVGAVSQTLDRAERLITEHIGAIASRSTDHTTEAWGFSSANAFTNRAWVVKTTLEPMEVMDTLLCIEAKCGRDRKGEYRNKVLGGESYANRIVDLDILLYDSEVVVTPHLQIPHPMLLERDFALQPMAEAMGISTEQAVELVTKIVKDEI